MRNKKTFILLYLVVAVLLLGVAYASIQNINLKITGSAGATPDQANFKVAFTGEPTFTGKGTADLAITGDLTATMNVSGLDGVGDTFTATFAVANTSTDITAYLTSEVTNVNTKYFEVTSSLEKEVLEPQTGITNLNVTVKCIRTPITGDEKDTLTVEVIASPTPIEDEEGGEDIGGGIIGGDTGETETDLELMQRYVLGADKTGRSAFEIANVDMETYQITSLKDDPESITDASTTVAVTFQSIPEGIVHVKYNNTTYKVMVDVATLFTESVEVFIETELELMQRYILGPDKTGRSALEIVNLDMTTMQVISFIDDPESIKDASKTVTVVEQLPMDSTIILYARYNNISYIIYANGDTGMTYAVEMETPKIKLDKKTIVKTETLTATLTNLDESKLEWTSSNENVAVIEGTGTTVNVVIKSTTVGETATITAKCGEYSASCNVNVMAGREGQSVAYDSNNDGVKEDWIVLTDRNGLVEIVSAAPMGSLTLGYNDKSVEVTTDLDGDRTVGDNEDKAIASYNNAITTINNYCKSLVTATNNGGVRSVGASSDTSGNYSSTNFNSWFKNSETVKVKAKDEYYKTDLERMRDLGIAAAGDYYWIASRFVVEYSSYVNFSVGIVYTDGGWYGSSLWYVYSDGYVNSYRTSLSVRPVVINPSGI